MAEPASAFDDAPREPSETPRDLLLLGATGSIGQSALAVARAHPGRFRVRGLVARRDVAGLALAAHEFGASHVALAEESLLEDLRAAVAGLDPRPAVHAGAAGILDCIAGCGATICLSAIVGSAGLAPTLAALEAGMDVALANKEALVAGGALVTERARVLGRRLLPVDSEHSAILQCLQGHAPEAIRRLVLTASGGPFRGWSRERLATVTPQAALAHPTWSMGRKVTIDSATLANKALEVIEAHWLFGYDFDRIDALIHPQSIVHGMVEFVDGGWLAHLAPPDMCLPILHALAAPTRLEWPRARLDWTTVGTLTFEPPDRESFPMLDLGYAAGRAGGLAPAVYAAADEEAVSAFLAERLPFGRIPAVVEAALHSVPNGAADSLECIAEVEENARAVVRRSI